MINHKEIWRKEVAELRKRADNLEEWITKLTEDGFDFENVTEAQAWAIDKLACPK